MKKRGVVNGRRRELTVSSRRKSRPFTSSRLSLQPRDVILGRWNRGAPLDLGPKYDTLSHMTGGSVKSKISAERQKFSQHLRAKGLRLSGGRQKVFDIVIATHGHFAAEEVVKICQDQGVTVSRATIYRSFKELLEAGIIRETAFGQKHQLFEHVYDEKLHHHARCIRCSGYVEFPDLGEDTMYRPILERAGFHILGHEMHFYGLCKDCQ